MNEKFANVPMESDTRLLTQADAQVKGIDALYQIWIWEGITAESLIFANADVADLDELALKALVSDSIYAKNESIDKMTYSQSQTGYTFINFNFKTD